MNNDDHYAPDDEGPEIGSAEWRRDVRRVHREEQRAVQAAAEKSQARSDQFWYALGEQIGEVLAEELEKRDRQLNALEHDVDRLERRGRRIECDVETLLAANDDVVAGARAVTGEAALNVSLAGSLTQIHARLQGKRTDASLIGLADGPRSYLSPEVPAAGTRALKPLESLPLPGGIRHAPALCKLVVDVIARQRSRDELILRAAAAMCELETLLGIPHAESALDAALKAQPAPVGARDGDFVVDCRPLTSPKAGASWAPHALATIIAVQGRRDVVLMDALDALKSVRTALYQLRGCAMTTPVPRVAGRIVRARPSAEAVPAFVEVDRARGPFGPEVLKVPEDANAVTRSVLLALADFIAGRDEHLADLKRRADALLGAIAETASQSEGAP